MVSAAADSESSVVTARFGKDSRSVSAIRLSNCSPVLLFVAP
jgi:hypothetical protein